MKVAVAILKWVLTIALVIAAASWTFVMIMAEVVGPASFLSAEIVGVGAVTGALTTLVGVVVILLAMWGRDRTRLLSLLALPLTLGAVFLANRWVMVKESGHVQVVNLLTLDDPLNFQAARWPCVEASTFNLTFVDPRSLRRQQAFRGIWPWRFSDRSVEKLRARFEDYESEFAARDVKLDGRTCEQVLNERPN